MKNAFLLFAILLLVCCFSAVAQQNEPVRKNKQMMHDMSPNHQMRMHQRINTHNGLLKNSDSNNPQPISDLTEFRELPFQDPDLSYYEVAPIALSNGNILMIWGSFDTFNFTDDSLFCATSNDGGLTWNNKIVIAHSPFSSIFDVIGLQTNSGRIIVLWTDWSSSPVTKMIYSDYNGDSWSSVTSLPVSSYGAFLPSVSQSINNTIYLSYSRDISGDFSYWDIVFRTSTDDGLTWSSEKTLSDNQVLQNMGSIITGNGTELLAIYSKSMGSSWGIVKRSSSDGGDSWGAETTLQDSLVDDDFARAVRINNDTLCIVYMSGNYPFYDIYYSFSGDNGNTWSTPVQFTRNAGYDGYFPNFCLYNNKPFVTFSSDRWQQVYNIPHIWYGMIGITQDNNPPPAVLYSDALYKSYFAPDKVETILASIGDESGVQNAQVNISLNGGAEYSLQLFDDGQHSDWDVGDGIYGITAGPFSLGDHLDYSFSVTDVDNNSINVHGFAIDVVHHSNPVNPNKGFEETPVGIIGGDITGWGLYQSSPASAEFEIVDDTVKEGNRALKINVTALGVNPWDVQTVNYPFPVEPDAQYRYFIWAKADKDSVFANFTVADPSFNEWLSAYQIPLTTEWQEYSFDFFTLADATAGRVANHFGLSDNNQFLPVTFYIDDLRIVKLGSTVDVENNPAEIPSEFSLSQNYPNPFNPSTVINYQLAVGSQVTIKIYDVLGREIVQLVNEEKPAGNYTVNFDASALSSGVYFYKIEAGEFVQTKKMIFLR